MEKLTTGILPVRTGYYKHDYYIFEYATNSRCSPLPDNCFLLSYCFQYSDITLRSFLKQLINNEVPIFTDLLRDLQTLHWRISQNEMPSSARPVLHDAEQVISTFNKYLIAYVIPWFKSHSKNSCYKHNFGEYLDHFSLFTEDISKRISALIQRLELTAKDMDIHDDSRITIVQFARTLSLFKKRLNWIFERIRDAKTEHREPANLMTLN